MTEPELKINNLYFVLSSRKIPGNYHWGLLLPLAPTTALYMHSTNIRHISPDETWVSQVITLTSPYPTLNAVAYYFISSIDLVKVNTVKSVAEKVDVPRHGGPSMRTGEEFCCRVWVEDVLFNLEKEGVISDVSEKMKELGEDALKLAVEVEQDVESGGRRALIVN
ncbi:hypothetical protein B0J14DRAFT_599609 [Halenospora varia]|nr:hypothetical protein B0J14DRAFT_599609 [Halenospora varia]